MSATLSFDGAILLGRQMEARRLFLEEMGAEGRPTPEEAAAIRAEWQPTRVLRV